MGPFIFVVVILLFMGVILYSVVMPKVMVKRGRKVDVRVITCEAKYIEDSETRERDVFYEVTVDFYGLYGETIVKKFQSETPYMEGDVIHSRYLDKKGLLWPNADTEAKEGPDRAIWLVIGFLVAMLALILFVVFGSDENGNLPDWFAIGFGYFISVLFIIIGVWGIYKQILLKRKQPDMQVLSGVVADYTVEHGNGDSSDSYFPIYEYEWRGEAKRFRGSSGGTSKKYRTIGRKVHILREPDTGKVLCKEDETGHAWFFMIFLLLGIVAFVALLFGGFSTGNTDGTGTANKSPQENNADTDKELTDAESGVTPPWEMYYMYTDETAEKCSYSIRIFDDCSGQVILFPNVTVSGKGIDQFISFEVSFSDMIKIGNWLEENDYESLTFAPERAGEEVQICLNLYTDEEERYSGRDYPDNEIYAGALELMKDVVPKKVWKEIQEREEDYYN